MNLALGLKNDYKRKSLYSCRCLQKILKNAIPIIFPIRSMVILRLNMIWRASFLGGWRVGRGRGTTCHNTCFQFGRKKYQNVYINQACFLTNNFEALNEIEHYYVLLRYLKNLL